MFMPEISNLFQGRKLYVVNLAVEKCIISILGGIFVGGMTGFWHPDVEAVKRKSAALLCG